jgi:hypothetical protein
MTNQKIAEIVLEQLEYCQNLMVAKGAEYSLTEDRLEVFKKAASLQGETVKQALCGMLAKHVISVYDMCMTDGTFTLGRWEEKITDSINYLLLLKAAVMEEYDGQD